MIINENSEEMQKHWRVKLYELNGGQWIDNGTGFVKVLVHPTPKIVMTEEGNETKMFELDIDNNNEFHLQRKTILTWKSDLKEKDDNIGISFQDKDGINQIRKFIRRHTGRDLDDEIENIRDSISNVSKDSLPFIAREIRQVSYYFNNTFNRM